MFDPVPLMTQPAILTRRLLDDTSSTDDYGNPIPTEVTEAALCHKQPSGRADEHGEKAGLADVQSETETVFFPPDTPVDGLDAITVDGVQYELVGPPSRWFHPRRQRYLYVQATVKRAA